MLEMRRRSRRIALFCDQLLIRTHWRGSLSRVIARSPEAESTPLQLALILCPAIGLTLSTHEASVTPACGRFVFVFAVIAAFGLTDGRLSRGDEPSPNRQRYACDLDPNLSRIQFFEWHGAPFRLGGVRRRRAAPQSIANR